MKRERGVTLLELMVTLAVAAIVLTIAVPSFQNMFNRNRIATVANDFINSLYYTRSEAIKNSQTTMICMSSNQSSCTSNSGWANGWIVWVDRNGNGTLDAGELVRTHSAINAGNTTLGGGTKNSFAFNAQGTLTSTTGGDTILVCTPSDLSLARQVVVNASGLVATQAPATVPANCP